MAQANAMKSQYHKYIPFLILIFPFLLYVNTLSHDFAFDDNSVIVKNSLVTQGTDGIDELLKTSYRYGYWSSKGTLYRPASLVMFAVEWELWPDNPFPGHLINVLLYALLCLVLFNVLRRLLQSKKLIIPLIATLLFAVHPIHTEVVANIKGRDEILAMLFGLLQILFFLRFWDGGRKPLDMVLSVVAFALALLSKESGILFSAFLILGVVMFRKVNLKKDVLLALPFVFVFIIYLIIRSSVLDGLEGVNNVSVVDNFLVGADGKVSFFATAFQVLGIYLYKLLLSYPLMSDASLAHFEYVDLASWKFIVPFVVYMGLLAVAVLSFRKHPLLSFGLAIFLLSVLFVSNLFILTGTSYGERLLFVPSLGIVLALTFFLSRFYEDRRYKKLVLAGLVLIGVVDIVLTIDRNADWRNNLTLYEADIEKVPQSAKMNVYLAMEYVQDANELKKEGKDTGTRYTDAEALLQKALSIYPDYFDAYERLAMIYYQQKNYQKALDYYGMALQFNPTFANAYSNMGAIYFDQANYVKAIEVYTKAVEFNPRFADAYMNLASAHASRAVKISAQDIDGAIRHLELAVQYFSACVQLSPQNQTARNFLETSKRQLNQARTIKAQHQNLLRN